MKAHTGIANKLIDTVAQSTVSSSPLRRKSIMLQKTVVPSSIVENDDEAERLSRRREFSGTSISLSAANANDRRCSLGLSALGSIPSAQMEASISQCIKLGTENKINQKNAFSLEMIDFMTYMIKKRDANMSNLQVASVSLDVSTKIYAFRVDGVHMDILKLIGGLENQEKNNENTRGNDAELINTEEGNENNQDQTKKKTRKRMKQQILVTVESLRTNVETEKSTLTSMESDLQTTDMLSQATLPNHAGSRFYFHPYNDILMDIVECKQIQDNDVDYSIPTIKDISQMQICPPMFYFDFQSFDANDKTEEVQPEKLNENTFQFDLDASLPQDNDESCAAVNYFDVDMQEENVDTCVKLPGQIESIVDFREVLATTVQSKPSEYSYIRQNLNMHWTGPSHWKLTNSKKNFSNSNIMEKCHQAPNRRKKELEISYGIEITESMEAKYLQNKGSKMHTRVPRMEWNEEILTLPPDQHYDVAHANKSYLHAIIFKPFETTDEMNPTDVSDIVENYDNNDNDTSNYCPQTNVDEYRGSEESNAIHEGPAFIDKCMSSTQPLTGSNLVTMPKLTNKTTIAYCARAKRIDMKKLKDAIWTCLSQDSNDQDMIANANKNLQNSNNTIGIKSFNKIYKMLPMLLTKNNVESLSFPISFVSLLHLANEKTLQVSSSLDMTDLLVKQD